MKRTITIFVCSFFSLVFANFPYRNSLEVSTLLYRYSYSEEFGNEEGFIGFPRSDEYGPTAGVETEYNLFDPKSKFTFGIGFNLSRSIKHTYDGSQQGDFFYYMRGDFEGDELVYKKDSVLFYRPIIEDTDNYFYGANIKFGYIIPISRQTIFEPKITTAFDYWKRPIKPIVEDYLWLRILAGVSLTTKNSDNLGIVSDLALSVPIWQKMYLRYNNPSGNIKYTFDIGGKVGWQFKFGFARYYADNLTLKIVYFYEYYGFKASPVIPLTTENGILGFYEPSSSTHKNGVKISFEKGFGK